MTQEEKELKEKLDKYDIDSIFKEIVNSGVKEPIEEYYNHPIVKEYYNLEREYRLITTDYEMTPIPDFGEHYTLSEFIEDCMEGGLIDSDGGGYYATETQESSIPIYPSDIICGKYRKDFSHVIWYNR